MTFRAVLCLHVLVTPAVRADYCLRKFRELIRGETRYSEVAHSDPSLSPLLSTEKRLPILGEVRDQVEVFDRKIAASKSLAEAHTATAQKIGFLEKELGAATPKTYLPSWFRLMQAEIDRLKGVQKENGNFSLWRRLFAPSPLSQHVAQREEAISRLQEIRRQLHQYDPFSPQFQKLLQEQSKIIESNYAGVLGAKEFVDANDKAFVATQMTNSDPLHLDRPHDRGYSAEANSVRLDYLAGRELTVRSGSVEAAVREARSVLRDRDPNQYLENRGPDATIRMGHPEVFIAAEKLFLSQKLFFAPALTKAELELVDAYEKTLTPLRQQKHAIQGAGPAESLELGTFAALLSESKIPVQNKVYEIPLGESVGEETVTPHQLALDRFRYLAAGQNGDAKSNSKDWLRWNQDLRQARYHRTRKDTWWTFQENVAGQYLGWAALRRDRALNFSEDRKILTFENMLSGDLTNQFINGDGYAGVDGKNYLLRGTNPAEIGLPRYSRPYDPAQRYADAKRDNVREHIPGWFQVAEIPLGESANSQLNGFIRRVFWNEGHDPTGLGGAYVGKGETRIAQQSIPLRTALERLGADHPLQKTLNPAFIAANHGKKMTPALQGLLQKQIGELGEIDPVRWEVITGIEAIIEDNGLAQPMQWKWDAGQSRWVPQDSVPAKEGSKNSEEPIFRACAACHSRGGLLNVSSFSGACKVDQRTQTFFSSSAQRVLLER